MELFQIIMPKSIDSVFPLYVRLEKGGINQNMSLQAGTVLSFDTYFNSFSCTKYLRYTIIRAIKAEICITGSFSLELCFHQEGKVESVAASLETSSDFSGPVAVPFDISDKTEECICYFRLTAREDGCQVLGGRYTAEVEPHFARMAITICTFRRERYVLATIEKLRRALLADEASPVRSLLEIYVVDNGGTLGERLPDDPRIHLIKNKDCSGFTRGMIELLQKRDEFTHILLMDDDIVVEPGSIIKTIQFLSVTKPEYSELFVAGGMLLLDQPTIQYEATARWDGYEHPIKAQLDLSKKQSLFENEKEEKADYGGWWCLCIPLCVISENNLPLPFFFRNDDIEFGLRNMRQCLVLNGIGVWHQSFSAKFSTLHYYYIIRNQLVVNAIYGMMEPVGAFLWRLLKLTLKAVAYEHVGMIDYLELAVNHYLSGVNFFLSTDGEQLHTDLLKRNSQPEILTKRTARERISVLVPKLFSIKLWQAVPRFCRMAVQYLRKHRQAERDFRLRWREITCLDFWEKQLCLTDNHPIK